MPTTATRRAAPPGWTAVYTARGTAARWAGGRAALRARTAAGAGPTGGGRATARRRGGLRVPRGRRSGDGARGRARARPRSARRGEATTPSDVASALGTVARVVLLRGVNVGGHRTFRPAHLARQLKHLD